VELPKKLARRTWVNGLTGRSIPAGSGLRLGELLADFPVALLLDAAAAPGSLFPPEGGGQHDEQGEDFQAAEDHGE
jgi:hypothetical protein